MKNYIFITIILALFFGLIAGFAGQILSRYYISQDLAGFALTREFDLLDGRSNLIIRDPRKVVVSQDAKVEEIAETVSYSLYKLFNIKETAEYIDLNNPLALTLAVSSDGWFLTTLDDDLISLEKMNLKLLGPDDNFYEIEEIIVKKLNASNLIFLKADRLNQAIVRRSVSSQEMKAGQSLIAIKKNKALSLASLIDYGNLESILSSDKFNRKLSILAPDEFLENSFVFNLAGDFVGLLDNNKDFYLAPILANYWRSLLDQSEISLPELGILYLDLSQIKFLENNFNRGALIDQVIKNSPADLAGLKSGDIISHINGQELNSNLGLSDIILSLNSRDEIKINYYRNQEEYNITIILD
jgi:hypothetical protein